MLKDIIITIISVLGAGTIALIVAYMDRRQARQIEMHRLDPTVPLTPPPNVVRVFLSKNSSRLYSALACVWTVGTLIRDISKAGPVTRFDVLYISMEVGSLFYVFVMTLIAESTRSAYRVSRMQLDVFDHLFERIGAMEKFLAVKKTVTQQAPAVEGPESKIGELPASTSSDNLYD